VEAAIAAASIGGRDVARELASKEVEEARRFGAARPVWVALRTAGLVERGEAGVALLAPGGRDAQVIAVTARTRADAHRARRCSAPRWTAGRAREQLRVGLAMVERFGALRLERRARAELEATGARAQRRTLTGPGSLTPSGRRVAEMASGAMTNREIAQALFVTVKAVKFRSTRLSASSTCLAR
jgi:hypothetical protein